MSDRLVYTTSTETARAAEQHKQAVAALHTIAAAPAQPKPAPHYGACMGCGAIETRLTEVVGHRDLRDIGESRHYPLGWSCQFCA